MSLGDGRNNNNGNKMFENTYYSRIRFKDYEKKLTLGFQFKSGMLVVDISKEKEGFEYETVANIFITPTKAKLLEAMINQFKADMEAGIPIPENGYGINAGMGEIVSVLALHTTKDDGIGVTIGKVDGSGSYTTKVDFTFNKQFHYGLKWGNVETMDVEKQYIDTVEFDQFCDIITQFAIASSGATAYSVADLTRYDHRALMNRFNPIYDKLGIERGNGSGGRGNYSNNNFFNGNNGGSKPASNSSHKSYEDAMDDLPFEED